MGARLGELPQRGLDLDGRDSGLQSTFHLRVVNYSGLLRYRASFKQDYEIGDPADVVSRCHVRVSLCIDFHN